MKQLEIKHLTPYLPYGLKVKTDRWVEEIGDIDGISSTLNEIRVTLIINRNKSKTSATTWTPQLIHCKPILYPLDYLTKEITHNGETFVPIEHFEIGDDDNYCYEFDNGNIKLIQNLKSIAKYNNWHDINFLPFAVIQQLIEWRFDVFNLINDGLAIPVTEDFNPYK